MQRSSSSNVSELSGEVVKLSGELIELNSELVQLVTQFLHMLSDLFASFICLPFLLGDKNTSALALLLLVNVLLYHSPGDTQYPILTGKLQFRIMCWSLTFSLSKIFFQLFLTVFRGVTLFWGVFLALTSFWPDAFGGPSGSAMAMCDLGQGGGGEVGEDVVDRCQ